MRKLVAAGVAWTILIGLVYLTSHPSPSAILSVVGDGVTSPRGTDQGQPQLVAWFVGIAVIVVVGLLSQRRSRS